MDEEKRNKIIAAITVNAILLVFILLAVVISQIVTIAVLRRRKAALISQYNTLVRELEDVEDVIEKNEKDSQIQDLIRAMYSLGMTEEEIKNLLIPTSAANDNTQLVWVAPDLNL